MSRGQTAFETGKYKVTPLNLTDEDLKVMRLWKTVKAQCPWCFYTSDLWSFATFNYRKKKGKTVNMQKCECPDCGAGVMRRTLLKIYNMSMQEYGRWFWDSVFTGGSYDKVQWEQLKSRLRSGFSYSECEPFWQEYWLHKEMSLSGWNADADEDDDAYEDFAAQFEPEEDEPR